MKWAMGPATQVSHSSQEKRHPAESLQFDAKDNLLLQLGKWSLRQPCGDVLALANAPLDHLSPNGDRGPARVDGANSVRLKGPE